MNNSLFWLLIGICLIVWIALMALMYSCSEDAKMASLN